MTALTLVMAVASCGGSRAGSGEAKTAGGHVDVRTCSGAVATNATPIGRPSSSASVALAKVGGRRVALLADEDDKAIVTIDLDTRAELARTPVGGAPSQIYVAQDGHVFVTVRDQNLVLMLAATRADAPLAVACGAPTPSEPIAIGGSTNDAQLVVTSGWGKRVTVFDAKTLARKAEIAVPREPRAVVVADDGKTAFVSHAVGSLVSVVDLAGAKPSSKPIPIRPLNDQARAFALHAAKTPGFLNDPAMKHIADGFESCQGFALAKSSAAPGRIFAPAVAVESGEPATRPDGYGSVERPTEMPDVAVLDEGKAAPMESSIRVSQVAPFVGRSSDVRDGTPACLLPRAAAIDPASRSLLVTCYGIDSVVAYDATAANPTLAERRRWAVGAGPSGIAVDVEKGRAVVWSQFDRSVSTFAIGGRDLAEAAPAVETTRLPAPATKLSPEYTLGRILFHAAGDRRISHDGRACASCHPDGRDDAITWATPEGPRRSIMLAGRVTQSSPYAWNGNATTIPGHLGNTFDRLSGSGLRSVELDALVSYVSTMPAPTSASVDGAEAKKAERGREIFASSEAGCAGCHSGAAYTDGLNHDVGSRNKADRGSAFNTPSLHLVGGTGPYFHDGRYATLSDLLVKSDGKMGHTKHLSQADLESLESFLRTL